MDLELTLKINKVRDDLASVGLRIAKDRAGPLFLSRETETMFILTAHLKGFAREKIKIEINEDGTLLVISGEKPVQEMVMVGWKVHKNEAEIRGFRKVFRIPDGVVLDRIKAKFNEDEAILTIVMPKSIKGVRGVGIEQVKDENVDRRGSETTQIAADELPEQERMPFEQESIEPEIKDTEKFERGVEIEETIPEKTEPPPPENTRAEKLPDLENRVESEKPEGGSEVVRDQVIQQSQVEEEHAKGEIPLVESEIPQGGSQKEVEQESELVQSEKTEPPPPEKSLAEELPDLKEAVTKEEIPEAESKKPEGGSEVVRDQVIQQSGLPNKTSTREVFEESPQVESKMPQEESQKHETKTDIQESVQVKPDQELEQTATPHPDHPADQEKSDEQEKSRGVGNEIQEVKPPKEKEVDDHGSSEVEKQKGGAIDEATQKKKPHSEKSKLCAPCFIAGSAFLVSIIAFVFHLIRGKKR